MRKKKIPISIRIVSFYYYLKFRFGSKKIHVENLEQQFLQNIAVKDKHIALMNLRFEVWLKRNRLKPGALDKAKMRQAFHAGWEAKGWGNGN